MLKQVGSSVQRSPLNLIWRNYTSLYQGTILLLIFSFAALGFPSISQAQGKQRFRSFADWCTSRMSLSQGARTTVNALLKVANTTDCQQASQKLLTLRSLILRGPHGGGYSNGDLEYFYPDFSGRKGQITDLSPLVTLPQLNTLLLGNNQITDISPLQFLPNLNQLELSYNQVRDVSPLHSLKKLQILYLKENRIADLRPLQSIDTLMILSLRGNPISNISPLQSLNDLRKLDLSGLTNPNSRRHSITGDPTGLLSDLSPLQGLINLKELALDDNQISDIRPLRALTRLSKLTLNNNKLDDISSLQGMNDLWELWLRDNQIMDITPLQFLTDLRYLNLTNNRISDANSLQSLTKLHELYLDDNPVIKKICLKQEKLLVGLQCPSAATNEPLYPSPAPLRSLSSSTNPATPIKPVPLTQSLLSIPSPPSIPSIDLPSNYLLVLDSPNSLSNRQTELTLPEYIARAILTDPQAAVKLRREFAALDTLDASMSPTLLVGDKALIDRQAYQFHPPKRGDIVAFSPATLEPQQGDVVIGGIRGLFFQRVVGLPEETIEVKSGKVYVNGRPLQEDYIIEPVVITIDNRPVKVPANHYLVVGDNAYAQLDFAVPRLIQRSLIYGKAIGIYCPIKRQRVLNASEPLTAQHQIVLAKVQTLFQGSSPMCNLR